MLRQKESAFVSAGAPGGLPALTRPKILIRRCKREVSWGGGGVKRELDKEERRGGGGWSEQRGRGSCWAKFAFGGKWGIYTPGT